MRRFLRIMFSPTLAVSMNDLAYLNRVGRGLIVLMALLVAAMVWDLWATQRVVTPQLQFLHRIGFALTLIFSVILALMAWQLLTPPRFVLPTV